MKKVATRAGAGRPPSGPGGEPVSTYPRLAMRLPRETKDQLRSLSTLRRVPVWKLINDAVLAMIEQLPESERKLVKQFTARMAG